MKRAKAQRKAPSASSEPKLQGALLPGDPIEHPVHGLGTVTKVEDDKIRARFARGQTKSFNASHSGVRRGSARPGSGSSPDEGFIPQWHRVPDLLGTLQRAGFKALKPRPGERVVVTGQGRADRLVIVMTKGLRAGMARAAGNPPTGMTNAYRKVASQVFREIDGWLEEAARTRKTGTLIDRLVDARTTLREAAALRVPPSPGKSLDQEAGDSIRTVSGGLPTLGKRR